MSVFHKNTLVLVSSCASSTKTHRFWASSCASSTKTYRFSSFCASSTKARCFWTTHPRYYHHSTGLHCDLSICMHCKHGSCTYHDHIMSMCYDHRICIADRPNNQTIEWPFARSRGQTIERPREGAVLLNCFRFYNQHPCPKKEIFFSGGSASVEQNHSAPHAPQIHTPHKRLHELIVIGHGCPKKGTPFEAQLHPRTPKRQCWTMPAFAADRYSKKITSFNIVLWGVKGSWTASPHVSCAASCGVPFFGQGGWL